MGIILAVCVGAIIGALIILFALIPSIIAEKRGVRKVDVNIILVLGLLGILFLPLWVLAFILSLVYQPEKNSK